MAEPYTPKKPEYNNRPVFNSAAKYNMRYDPKNPSEALVEGFARIQAEADARLQKNQFDAVNDATKNQGWLQNEHFKITENSKTNFYKINRQTQNDYLFNAGKLANERYLGERTIEGNFYSKLNQTDSDERIGKQANEFKLYSNLDSNQKTLEASKYGDQLKTALGMYQWTTLNPTSIAEAQIKAGSYGVNKQDLSNRAASKAYDDKMSAYAAQQLEMDKYNRSLGASYQAYSDSRLDLKNAQSAAMNRYSIEQYEKADAIRYQREQDKLNRDWVKQQFATTTSQWDRDYALKREQYAQDLALRTQSLANQTNQINSNIGLDNSKFTASRADLAYNRKYQSRSFAF
jgi:hypothetical protein